MCAGYHIFAETFSLMQSLLLQDLLVAGLHGQCVEFLACNFQDMSSAELPSDLTANVFLEHFRHAYTFAMKERHYQGRCQKVSTWTAV